MGTSLKYSIMYKSHNKCMKKVSREFNYQYYAASDSYKFNNIIHSGLLVDHTHIIQQISWQ